MISNDRYDDDNNNNKMIMINKYMQIMRMDLPLKRIVIMITLIMAIIITLQMIRMIIMITIIVVIIILPVINRNTIENLVKKTIIAIFMIMTTTNMTIMIMISTNMTIMKKIMIIIRAQSIRSGNKRSHKNISSASSSQKEYT